MSKESCHTSLKCWTPKEPVSICDDLELFIVTMLLDDGSIGNDIIVVNKSGRTALNVVLSVNIASGSLVEDGVNNRFIMNATNTQGTWTIGSLNAGAIKFSFFDFEGPFEFTMTFDTPTCKPIQRTVSWPQLDTHNIVAENIPKHIREKIESYRAQRIK